MEKLRHLDEKARGVLGSSPLDELEPDLAEELARDTDSLSKKQAQAEDRRKVRQNGLDTEAAALRAQKTYPPFVDDVLSKLEAALVARRLDGQRAAKKQPALKLSALPVAILEDHARLDIRVLARMGLVVAGQRTGVLLDWGDLPVEVDGVHLFIDLRDAKNPFIALEHVTQGEVGYQLLRLARPDEGQRWAMLCPITQKPALVLAFRDGRFASSSAQRLVNRSQRK